MWGLAAAFGPVGWVVAAVGTVATACVLMDDEEETSSYSNKSQKEAEVKEQTKKEKRKNIMQEIEAYKKQQRKRLKDKYDIEVEFASATMGGSFEVPRINSMLFNTVLGISGVELDKEILNERTAEKIIISEKNKIDTIAILENETDEVIELIAKLEVDKHESI